MSSNRPRRPAGASPFAVAAAAASLLLLSACGSAADGTAAASGDPVTLAAIEGEWTLASALVDDADLAITDGSEPTLEIAADGGVAGTGGCNRFTGRLDISDDGAISAGPFASTMMFCDGLMETETSYLGSLEKVSTGALDGDDLTLTGDGVELHFARA